MQVPKKQMMEEVERRVCVAVCSKNPRKPNQGWMEEWNGQERKKIPFLCKCPKEKCHKENRFDRLGLIMFSLLSSCVVQERRERCGTPAPLPAHCLPHHLHHHLTLIWHVMPACSGEQVREGEGRACLSSSSPLHHHPAPAILHPHHGQ